MYLLDVSYKKEWMENYKNFLAILNEFRARINYRLIISYEKSDVFFALSSCFLFILFLSIYSHIYISITIKWKFKNELFSFSFFLFRYLYANPSLTILEQHDYKSIKFIYFKYLVASQLVVAKNTIQSSFSSFTIPSRNFAFVECRRKFLTQCTIHSFHS